MIRLRNLHYVARCRTWRGQSCLPRRDSSRRSRLALPVSKQPIPRSARDPLVALPLSSQRGVTLMEMLVVMALIALLAALSLPSFTTGMDSIRLRSAASSVISTFNLALTRADRLQEAVDVTVSPARHLVEARTMATGIVRRAELPKEVSIAHVYPEEGLLTASEEGRPPDRHFIVYPNGAVPRITLDLVNEHGTHRYVLLDPITGVARERVVTDPAAEYVDADHQTASAKDQP